MDSRIQELQRQLDALKLETRPKTDYNTQLLVAIGASLDEAQQLWLSNSANNALIPEFLATPTGQAITKRFFNAYKQYKEQ
jgi:hypothetical protein